MFAAIVQVHGGPLLRSSWHATLAQAKKEAEVSPGIIAIEEIGVGIIWRKIDLMTKKQAQQITGNQPKWALRNMRKALEMMPSLNTSDDWRRLEACYVLMGTPHAKRISK